MPTGPFKFKVCLAGEPGVGKTSLIRRFVLDQFDDRYLKTLGTKTSKRVVILRQGSREVQATLMIWDIMGDKSVRHLLVDAFYEGADGLIAVCDLTRASTLNDLEGWFMALQRVVGRVPTIVVGNKVDLEDQVQVPEGTFLEFCQGHGTPYIFTSAKSGYNVASLFNRLGQAVLEQQSRVERIAPGAPGGWQ